MTIEALKRVKNDGCAEIEAENTGMSGAVLVPTDRWFHTLYAEASAVDEAFIREAFVRILAGEIQAPGSFSLRSLRVMGAISQSTAKHFLRAASVSIRLTFDGKHIMDARIPAIGGSLGQNCLSTDGLSYDVLLDLTENGLVHGDYNSYHPYGPLGLESSSKQFTQPMPSKVIQIPFFHQNTRRMLLHKNNQAQPINVTGAKFTSCGVELLNIVDIETLPNFTKRLEGHFSHLGYQMVQST